MKYRWLVEGTAFHGQTWSVEGTIEKETGADFTGLLTEVMTTSFVKLTQGRAVYGQPGVGCIGPYRVRRFEVVAEESA